jgi:hypothetical protein
MKGDKLPSEANFELFKTFLKTSFINKKISLLLQSDFYGLKIALRA